MSYRHMKQLERISGLYTEWKKPISKGHLLKVIAMLTSLTAVIILQCIHMSSYVHLEGMQFLFVNHMSIKLGKKERVKIKPCP